MSIVRRIPWYAKMDVRAYFASIRHSILMERIRRRIKGDDVLALVSLIVAAHGEGSGQDLPIASYALTSQCLANYYLRSRWIVSCLKTLLRPVDTCVTWMTSFSGRKLVRMRLGSPGRRANSWSERSP